MSPRPGRIEAVVDVDLGTRDEDTREDATFFARITEVREALRGRHGSWSAQQRLAAGLEDR
jgi:NitT/TauT family transport system ATP-binding protein